jgi:hypothetical protein
MRYILFVLALLLTMFNSVDGNTQDAAKIFKQVAEALTKLSFLQYDSYREINNYKDNYFAKNSGTSYLDFTSGVDGKALRLQLRSEKSLQVYNGTELFQLNESDKSSVFSKKDLRSLENLSLLYNSIPTLRVSLPLIAGDAGIPKSVKDTSIEGRTYYLLKFELSRKTLAFPSGFSDLDAEVTRYYDLVVNKKTLLPYIIIDPQQYYEGPVLYKNHFYQYRNPTRESFSGILVFFFLYRLLAKTGPEKEIVGGSRDKPAIMDFA